MRYRASSLQAQDLPRSRSRVARLDQVHLRRAKAPCQAAGGDRATSRARRREPERGARGGLTTLVRGADAIDLLIGFASPSALGSSVARCFSNWPRRWKKDKARRVVLAACRLPMPSDCEHAPVTFGSARMPGSTRPPSARRSMILQNPWSDGRRRLTVPTLSLTARDTASRRRANRRLLIANNFGII
jgi:hypothetical protein